MPLVSLALVSSANAAPVPPRAYAVGAASPSLRGLVDVLGGDAGSAASAQYAYLRKLDGHLQDLATARLDGRSVAAAASDEGVTVAGGSVSVDVYVDGDAGGAAGRLRALGMQVRAVGRLGKEPAVEGMLPVAELTDVAALASTRAVLAAYGYTDAGSVTSEGDAAHRGPQARALGPTGTGVPVGVISDSINLFAGGIADSQATGDLPAHVVSLEDDPSGLDEGRAMAEIVYDEAPGVTDMYFSTGTEGALVKAQSIQNLVAQGVKVIADDTFDPSEPDFQDGTVAQAVDAAKAAGVAYFASAGNRARQSWEGTYAPLADPRAVSPSTNDFGGADAVQTIGTFGSSAFFIALQWDEPFGAASTDLALDVYVNGSYSETFDTDNIATGIPEELGEVSVVNPSTTIGIAVRRVAGTRNPFMKYIVGGDTPTFTIAEHPTNSDTIDPDAASARGSMAVAASDFSTPATPEDFSSRGPVTRLFNAAGGRLATPDVRQKPNVDGADGVSTSVPGFAPFFGTSAATPSVAGVATLLRSANPAMPVDEVYAILQNAANNIDCTASAGVPDLDCGYGFVQADSAMAQALDTSPPAITQIVSPASPTGANGWYTSPVSVNFGAADAQSPVVDQSGCGGPTVVPGEGTAKFTCSATSAGGTSSSTVTIKHDQSAPSAPALKGIAAKHYAPGKLPRSTALSCTASDPGSGVDACTVAGYSGAAGRHTLTAKAVNDAGLSSSGTLAYTVDAVGALTLPSRLSVPGLLRSGLPITLTVASAGTRLTAKLTASVARAAAARTVVLGSLKKTLRAGKAKLRLKLSRAGKRLVAAGRVKNVKLTVTAKAGGLTNTSRHTFKLRRR